MAAATRIGDRRAEQGVTYPVVLGLLMAFALGTSVSVPLASTEMKRMQEAELLFRGMAYRNAIQSYYEAVPQAPEYPAELDDLINDRRFAHRRHIRRLYADPITGGAWELIRTAGGRIAGVRSRSGKKPLKTGNFPSGLEEFAAATRYQDWWFVFTKDNP